MISWEATMDFLSKILNLKLLLTLLILKLVLLIFLQIKFSSDFKTTLVFDNDGATAQHVLSKTMLTNNNKWYAYGPVYYRLARLFNIATNVESLKDEELKEEFYYFSLIFVSLLSFIGIFILIGCFAEFSLENFIWSFAAFFVFLSISTPEIFIRYIIFPHPDFTQTFLLVFAFVLFIKYAEARNNQKAFLGFFILGCSLATKATSVYFAFFYALMIFAFYRDFRSLKNFIFSFLSGASGYFLIGFPQNFKILKTVDFLKYASTFNLPATLTSVTNWFELLALNLVIVPAVLLINNKKTFTNKTLMFGASVCLFTFIFFVSTVNSAIWSKHYIIPYVAYFTLLTAVLVSIPKLSILKVIQKNSWGLKAFAVIAILIPIPKSFPDYLITKNSCRSSVELASDYFEKNKVNYDQSIVDAYFPYSRHLKYVNTWGVTINHMVAPKTIVGLNWNFINDFFSTIDAYNSKTNPNIKQNIAFYELIRGKEEFTRPALIAKKLKDFGCGLEVWSFSRTDR